jgi:hypothetical protein
VACLHGQLRHRNRDRPRLAPMKRPSPRFSLLRNTAAPTTTTQPLAGDLLLCNRPPTNQPANQPEPTKPARLTLAEPVLEAPGHVLHVAHAAGAGGVPADGLLPPLVWWGGGRGWFGGREGESGGRVRGGAAPLRQRRARTCRSPKRTRRRAQLRWMVQRCPAAGVKHPLFTATD